MFHKKFQVLEILWVGVGEDVHDKRFVQARMQAAGAPGLFSVSKQGVCQNYSQAGGQQGE